MHLEPLLEVSGQLVVVPLVARGEDEARDAGAPGGDGLLLDAPDGEDLACMCAE